MNRWARLGIALCLFAIILNVSYAISQVFLLLILVIPGLVVLWMMCMAIAFYLESRMFDE
jgi:RsiW-degrading membrane proteinase PrsW (M82 family)